MRIAVVIGHNERSTGARNSNYEADEFTFNQALAHEIEHNFAEYNLIDEIIVVYRDCPYAYLPVKINNINPDLIISLHCNAFDTHVQGCEVLYYHKSEVSKECARIFQNHLVQKLDNKDRGIKPKSSEDRGGYLLRYTHAPCVIVEPFFIDNDEDFLRASKFFDDGDLTRWYCEAINKAIQYLRNRF